LDVPSAREGRIAYGNKRPKSGTDVPPRIH
jgi:hypothetical protein